MERSLTPGGFSRRISRRVKNRRPNSGADNRTFKAAGRGLLASIVFGFAPLVRAGELTADANAARALADERLGIFLAWDAMEKTIDAKPGDGAAVFTFTATNRSTHAVTIREVYTSCGCTVVELPRRPWILAPGAKESMEAVVDIAGKEGRLTKTIEVDSTEGLQTLIVNVNLPAPTDESRERNRTLAAANRQAVFRGECASCHVVPIGAKMGGELFQAACAICHVSSHRASMVPDLLVARERRDGAYWRKWITEGRDQSLMPAFAQAQGGPLTAKQIDSLVEFVLKQLPTEPPAKK